MCVVVYSYDNTNMNRLNNCRFWLKHLKYMRWSLVWRWNWRLFICKMNSQTFHAEMSWGIKHTAAWYSCEKCLAHHVGDRGAGSYLILTEDSKTIKDCWTLWVQRFSAKFLKTVWNATKYKDTSVKIEILMFVPVWPTVRVLTFQCSRYYKCSICYQ